MKEEYSEKEIRYKAEVYCSSAEHCVSEVRTKLGQWGTSKEIEERVIKHLLADKFIDERRYCIAFIRDKYRFNQWGRMKMIQALRMKHISSDLINQGLEEIDEQEYSGILSTLIDRKRRSVTGRTEYERNGKLIRFAISKGFEMEAILHCIKQTDCHESYLE